MSHTHASVLVHCVFSTKNRANVIPDCDALWRYIAVLARDNKITLLAAGGTNNHVHLLMAMPPVLPLAKVMKELKGNTSHWLHERGHRFAWQEGYGGIQRRTIPAANRHRLHRWTGRAPQEVEFRTGVHDLAEKVRCGIRCAVRVRVAVPAGTGISYDSVPRTLSWAELSRPASRDGSAGCTSVTRRNHNAVCGPCRIWST